ncbi:MAG: hypothetical protein QOD56_2060 [Gammaproteobacteria bacterium]|nr:hypothetical protein [Gammaproteobacteria bacterium]
MSTPPVQPPLWRRGAIRFPAAKRQRRSISDFPNFFLTPRPNHLHIRRRPAPLRGALRNVTNVGRDAVDAGGALDGRCLLRTAKSCGPDAPTLASSRRDVIFAGEGGKKARSPGRARNKPLKPLRGECRVIPVPPAVTNARATHHTTRGCGRIGARHSLLPSWGSTVPSEGRGREA